MSSKPYQWRSPDDLHGISRKRRIGADHWKVFGERLSDKQAIKWVLVVKGQLVESIDMDWLYRQQPESIDFLLIFYKLRQRQVENQFAQLGFELHLPDADDAQQQLVLRILHCGERSG